MWLSTEILNWNATQEDASGFGDDSWKRAYDLWNHAQWVLHEHNEPLYLVDVITTLKRAINHRLQYLNNCYQFKKILTGKKSHGLLEQLADLGIIKPIMLKRLLDIRNEIEHQDAPPPPKDRSEEFLEFTWYFLRSTDKVATIVLENFQYEPECDEDYSPYWILVTTGPLKDWAIELKGWVQPSMLSEVEKENWLKVEMEQTLTRATFLVQYEEQPFCGYGKNQDDIWFTGALTGPEEYRNYLYRVYFSLL